VGVFGGFFILALCLAYSLYQLWGLPQGGPPVSRPFAGLPFLASITLVSREFLDLTLVVAVGATAMMVFELGGRGSRRAALLVAVLTVAGVLASAWGWPGKGLIPFPGWPAARLSWPEWLLLMAWLLFLLLLAGAVGASPRVQIGWRQALLSGLARWLGGGALLGAALFLALAHPFYAVPFYENWRLAGVLLFLLYLAAGPVYAVWTCWRRGTPYGENRDDPGFLVLWFGFRAWKDVRAGRFALPGLRAAAGGGRTGVLLRDLLVKLFFLPLMVVFLFSEYGQMHRAMASLSRAWLNDPVAARDLPQQAYQLLLHGMFLMDVAVGLIGYACASRWLGNKSRSVDPTLSGWLVTLICYPPFAGIMDGYLPFLAGAAPAAWVLPGSAADLLLKLATLLLTAVYVWATLVFGLRFSNLTHRGILGTGPYGWMRHPAYTAKNLSWWTMYAPQFSSPSQPLFLLGWNAIYYWRAMTEERHLRRDADYRAYSGQVRWRFIPGLW
jgi:protein-S-isoprenylcysteine O-methyltransferase Ste14